MRNGSLAERSLKSLASVNYLTGYGELRKAPWFDESRGSRGESSNDFFTVGSRKCAFRCYRDERKISMGFSFIQK